MNNLIKTKLGLSALSIFRGIMNRSVPRAFFRLLCSADKKPEEFLSAYGGFISLISERGCLDSLAYALTEAALFDDNCFTRAAVGGTQNKLRLRGDFVRGKPQRRRGAELIRLF